MWVQLTSTQRIDKQGKPVTYHAGDWVEVGRQTAELWLARGEARVPKVKGGIPLSKQASIVVLKAQAAVEFYANSLHGLGLDIPMQVGEPCLTSALTLLWDPSALLRPELVRVGYGLLETWEVACPLYSYKELAASLGTEEERKVTQTLIHDLRVPVYDTRLMFLRECETTRRLLGRWMAERWENGDERLAFMRAFYTVKPLMLALPITWTQPQAYAEAA